MGPSAAAQRAALQRGLLLLCCLTASVILAAPSPAPQALHATDHVIVRFKPVPAAAHTRGRSVPQALEQLKRQLPLPAGARLEEAAFARWKRDRARAQGQPADELDPGYFLYLRLPKSLTVEQCVERLQHHPFIDLVEPDGIGSGGDIIPNDPSFGSQWHHRNTGNPGADIKTPAAWEYTTGSPNVILAVLDTGLNMSLNEFTNRVVTGYDFVNSDGDPTDDQGHGTAVTGTAAANANNNQVVAGVNWQCRIMPIKVLNDQNTGLYSWWAQGVDYAVANGAKVINLSAGGSSSTSTPLTTAINNAIAAGVIFVTITHNDGSAIIRYPGTLTQAITVGATTSQDVRWSSSNYGSAIDLVAPGSSIYTVNRFGNASSWSGTSFAAPLVAGVCALLAGLNPGLTQAEAELILTQTADDQVGDAFDTPGFDIYYGHGRLNALRAIQGGNTNVANLLLTQTVLPDPVSVGCTLTVSLVVSNQGPAEATGVVVTNKHPGTASLLGVETSQGVFDPVGGNSVLFVLGTLPAGASASMKVHLQPQVAEPMLVSSSVTLDQDDPFSTDNLVNSLASAVLDAEPPLLAGANALPDATTIEAHFSEAVDPATALALEHYTLKDGDDMPLPILAATMTEDPSVIRLQTGLASSFSPYILEVSGVTDCTGLPMEGPASASVSVPVMELIPAGADWRYLDTGVAPAANWITGGFDDSLWAIGPAQLGYGDGDEATELGFGGNANNKHITTWFRKPFTIDNAIVWTNLQVALLRDDGAVVYLNGTEIFRSNMPGGTILPTTLASASVNNADESTYYLGGVPGSALVNGTNWLAVELHQATADSSDLSFDLRLTGQLRVRLRPPVFTRNPDSQTVVAGETVLFKVEVMGDQPMGFRWRKDFATVVPFGPGTTRLTLTNVQPADAGNYSVVATNAANTFPGVLSGIGALVVLPDRDGDLMPDAWEELFDLDPDQPEDGDGDADMDGVSNRDEFAGGTNPQDAGSVLRLDAITMSEGGVRLGFQAVSNKTYAVQYRNATDAGPWQWLADVPSAATNRVVEVEDPDPAAPQRVYRLATPHQP